MRTTVKPIGTLFVVGALLLAAGASISSAQVQTAWTNLAGGTYSTAGNWDNGVPLTGTNAWFGLVGQTYAVNFTGTANTKTVLVTGQNQNVTFNLGGNTYNVGSGAPVTASLPHVFVGTNATDSVSLLVTNGTINLIASGNYQMFQLNGASSLVISNGGRVLANDIDFKSSGTVLVGPRGYLGIPQDLAGTGSAALIVTNGGIAAIRPFNAGYFGNVLISGPGSTLTNYNGTINGSGGSAQINDGGLLYEPDGYNLWFGWNGGSSTVVVGNANSGSATGVISAVSLSLGRDNYLTAQHMTIYSNGLVNIRGNAHPLTVSQSDMFVGIASVLSMQGGQIQFATNSVLAIVTNAVLRGFGSMSLSQAGPNFAVKNDNGRIRPGDYGPTLTSNVVGIGTLSLRNGNFYQTNTTTSGRIAGINFEFSPAGNDQINIRNGLALFTAGSNVFALARGAPAPQPQTKYGVGVFDFLVATNITYSPGYDNLVNLLTNTYHLTYGVDFQYGVVNLGGGLFALELAFVPEPSTVLLLGLGGLLVWRRRARNGCRKTISNPITQPSVNNQKESRLMKTQASLIGTVIFGVLILAVAGVCADDSWINGNGNFSDGAKWSSGNPPLSADNAIFTNAGSYTVSFTGSAIDNRVVVSNNTTVTFDLAGKSWTNDNGYTVGLSGSPANVTFTSSGGQGTVRAPNSSYYGAHGLMLPTGSTLTITNVSLNVGRIGATEGSIDAYGTIKIQGPAAQLYEANTTAFGFGANVDASGGALLRLGGTTAGGGAALGNGVTVADSTITIRDGSQFLVSPGGGAAGVSVGFYGATTVNILTNSSWSVTDPTCNTILGVYRHYLSTAPYNGTVLIDSNSTASLNGLEIGYINPGVVAGNGLATVQDRSTLILSNGWMLVGAPNGTAYAGNTNAFILNNSTVRLGQSGINGTISNASILRATGTITGQGAGNFTLENVFASKYVGIAAVYTNASVFQVGFPTGKLTLNKGNLQSDANTRTYFSFSDTDLSQIYAPNGFVNLLGTNVFTLVGSATPVPGVKFGLGAYDFAIGTSINTNWQYNNLVNLLTNTYHLTYGVDFQYGVVSLGGGLFALELAFVPEPSTILLLGLGGLLVFRLRRGFLGQGRRKPGKPAGAAVAVALILAVAGVRANDSWVNGNGNFSDGAKWSSGNPPLSADNVIFTNAGPYTVSFTGSAVDSRLVVSNNTAVTFDLAGKTWTNDTGHTLGIIGSPATVTFTSSGGQGSAATPHSSYSSPAAGLSVPTGSTLTITNVSVTVGQTAVSEGTIDVYGTLKLQGPNARLWDQPTSNFRFGGNVEVSGGAQLQLGTAWNMDLGNAGIDSTITIRDGSQFLSAENNNNYQVDLGFNYATTLNVLTNSTWTITNPTGYGIVGYNRALGSAPYNGVLLVDANSTASLNGLMIGITRPGIIAGNGLATVQNGSTLILSNGWLCVTAPWGNVYAGNTNTFVLNNATVRLGQNGINGIITNAGIIRATGTITGQGTGNFTLRNMFVSGVFGQPAMAATNNAVFQVGSPTGRLTLNKGNLQSDPNTTTYFSFSDTDLSQIDAPNGFVNLLGTNVFTLVGSATPVPGAKFGLGVYDFAIGTSINTNWQYNNLVNLLTNTYHLTYGVDFQYGVVSLGGGLFALELAFVPEPSTVLLLGLGGLLAWRRMAKRGKTAAGR